MEFKKASKGCVAPARGAASSACSSCCSSDTLNTLTTSSRLSKLSGVSLLPVGLQPLVRAKVPLAISRKRSALNPPSQSMYSAHLWVASTVAYTGAAEGMGDGCCSLKGGQRGRGRQQVAPDRYDAHSCISRHVLPAPGGPNTSVRGPPASSPPRNAASQEGSSSGTRLLLSLCCIKSSRQVEGRGSSAVAASRRRQLLPACASVCEWGRGLLCISGGPGGNAGLPDIILRQAAAPMTNREVGPRGAPGADYRLQYS